MRLITEHERLQDSNKPFDQCEINDRIASEAISGVKTTVGHMTVRVDRIFENQA
ncbi:hypothetical protein [Sinorhizobium fredii]|uniref:hypothetical protein n=1 Tax=Rhizobium fredii TaxID=380 RepID=UPI0013042701|nr:hypothetical protein [Sinorhizobium fredii]